MRRYWRIYKTFARSSFQRELEFRANFCFKIAQNLIWGLFFVLILLVIYSNTDQVGGWNRGEAFILAGTIFLLDASLRMFFWSLLEIPENVRKGTLDFVVTKPIDSHFWVSTRKFDFGQMGSFVAGTATVVFGIVSSGLSPSTFQIAAYIWMTLCAIVTFFSINFMMMTLGIWWVRVDNLWVFSDTMMGISRFPIDIYSLWMQKIFTYLLPLAFFAYFPATQLRTSPQLWMIAVATAWAAVTFMASRVFWRYAMRSYGSASS